MNDPAAEFRRGQWEAVDALVNGRERLLLVQRTGWGKSAVYFLATRILRDGGRGPTLIVSPLLALMRNQIEAARRLRICAETINSTNQQDWPELQRAVLEGEVDILLVSPERLANDEFVEGVLLPMAEGIGLLVVDEAHCISDWGHDFRPDYRRLVNVIKRMPGNVPVLGTTATANNRVVEDAQEQLGRAGRAIEHAVGVLMTGTGDEDIHEYFRRKAFPREQNVTAILEALEQSNGLSARELEEAVNLRWKQIEHVLKFLSVENPAPVIKIDSKWKRTPVPYHMDHERIQRLTRQRETEWQEVQGYLGEQGCSCNSLRRRWMTLSHSHAENVPLALAGPLSVTRAGMKPR